jgi:hypothetical protein
MRLESHCIDARVSLTACQRAQRFRHVDLGIVEHLGTAVLRSKRQALGEAIDRDDPLRSEDERALDGELADRPASPDGNRIAWF